MPQHAPDAYACNASALHIFHIHDTDVGSGPIQLLDEANLCKKQGSFQLACKKFTQAGDKLKATALAKFAVSPPWGLPHASCKSPRPPRSSRVPSLLRLLLGHPFVALLRRPRRALARPVRAGRALPRTRGGPGLRAPRPPPAPPAPVAVFAIIVLSSIALALLLSRLLSFFFFFLLLL